MSDDIFEGQILAEKLSKLNSSQQSIESLSRWCISHRKKAKQIVETWDKAFNSSQRERRVSFLYLANDILQNSRRKGTEFVNEFWKVLPPALKHVYENSNENGKKAACRLVEIWEERKVFGSRGQNLKNEMLGKEPSPLVSNGSRGQNLKNEIVGKDPSPLVSNGKSSNPIKIVKRDAHSLRIKLAVGAMPEKILSAFQSVHDESTTEEVALNKCKGTIALVGKFEKDAENIHVHGDQQGSSMLDEMQKQENVLKQSIRQLENAEAIRAYLVSQLKEALRDQESELELIRTEMQVAQGHIEQMSNIKLRLISTPAPPSITAANQTLDPATVVEPAIPSTHHPTSTPPPPVLQPMNSFASLTRSSEEESNKAAAAAVAAKLTASTSSAQMLASVLSSLVAEEAASMNGGKRSAGFATSSPMFSPEKRPKLENPMPPTSVQPQFPPPPPPPPSIPSASSPANQFVQSAGLMMSMMPYGYGGNNLLPPPPPPLPPHIAMGLARPTPQPPQQPPPPPLQSQQQQQSQQPSGGGYYRPPGIGFFGQSQQPTTPPVPRP